ncbi:unnamed protein product [Oreochromis niloticus]|nr:unnamed protein product [Mustela putorius furo]
MSFLTIPSQEGLFKTIKTGRSGEDADSRSPMDAEDNQNDDDDDDDTEDVRFIPRCSPVPRKRGASIFDETAEYMRIHLALSAGKRVSFADTTGGDLVDVKEFVAFDSDDEDSIAKWDEEEAKYRKPEREPTYHVHPEFHAPTGNALLQAVRTNKVEVEQMSPAENEPLAFTGVIRVLNISFHKAVYVRSTMDNWATYFDHPAEYVPGSHDGETDKFSFKLSFAPPYTTHGSRIEFVVRYETSDGDYWANNSSMNYVVTLLLTYEDDSPHTNINTQEMKSILKPPKAYSMNNESEDELEKEEEEAGTSEARPGLLRPTPVCPVIVKPEIDVEQIAAHPSGPFVPPNQELPSDDGTLSAHTVFPGNQTSEQRVDSSPSTPPPASHPFLQQDSKPRSDISQTGREEIPLEASCMCLPATETTTGEDGAGEKPASHPCLELPAERACTPSVTQGFERDVAVGMSEPVEGLSESSSRSAVNHEASTPALLSPVAETQTSLKAEGEALPSPELPENTSVSTGVTEVSESVAQSVSALEEKEEAAHISPDTSLENEPSTASGFSEPQSEHNRNRNLLPSVIFLSGVVSLSIVLQEPTVLFLIGLIFVLCRL